MKEYSLCFPTRQNTAITPKRRRAESIVYRKGRYLSPQDVMSTLHQALHTISLRNLFATIAGTAILSPDCIRVNHSARWKKWKSGCPSRFLPPPLPFSSGTLRALLRWLSVLYETATLSVFWLIWFRVYCPSERSGLLCTCCSQISAACWEDLVARGSKLVLPSVTHHAASFIRCLFFLFLFQCKTATIPLFDWKIQS